MLDTPQNALSLERYHFKQTLWTAYSGPLACEAEMLGKYFLSIPEHLNCNHYYLHVTKYKILALFNLQDKHISGCDFVAAITVWLLQLVLSDTHQGWQKCCIALFSVTVHTVLFCWRLTVVSVLCNLSGLVWSSPLLCVRMYVNVPLE